MPNASTHAWLPEHDAEVIRLRDAGLSYGEIGRAVGKSHSAISGRLRRLGFAKPAVRLTPEERKRRKRQWDRDNRQRSVSHSQHKPSIPFSVSELLDVSPRHVSLLDLERNECRWPYGDGPFTFCGCAAEDGKPYCLPHNRQGTEPTRWRVRA